MLLNAILLHAHADPEKLAIVSDGRGATYGLFARIVLSVRDWIERSVSPGQGITPVCGGSLLAQWVTIIALRSLGRTTIAVSDLQTLKSLQLAGIDAVIWAPGGTQPHVPELSANGPPIIALPADVIRAAREQSLPAAPIAEQLGDFIEFTSGTTGNYKAIRRTGETFAALCERTAREFRIGTETVFHFGALAPWCAVGSKCPVTVWYEGGACVFDTRKDWPERLLDWPIDRLFAPPPSIEKLAAVAFGQRREALQIYSGGGFLSYPAVQALREKLGCSLFFNYAGTEFGIRLQNRVEHKDDVVWLSPFGEADLDIVDADGTACGVGIQGSLRAALHVCDPVGYIGDPEMSRAFFRGGYFHTGDLAVRREDGRIRVLGRVTDVLNVGGVKQPVAPVESWARRLLGVDNVCLFARQSAQGKAFLLAVIERENECDPQNVARLRAAVAPHFPEVVVRYIGEFPRKGPMQKIDRAALLEAADMSVGEG